MANAGGGRDRSNGRRRSSALVKAKAMLWGPVLSCFEFHFKQKDRVKQRMGKTGETWEQAWQGLQDEWGEHDVLNAQLPAFRAPPANRFASKSVAFMFLTISELNQQDLWMSWFKTASRDNYDVIVHNDKGGDIGELQKIARFVNPPTKTGWASSGLVRATVLLLREALRNPSNTHFVLLSNSDIPIHSFAEFHAAVTSKTRSRLNKMSLNWDESLGRDIWQPPNGEGWAGCVKPGCHSKADQWAMWTREDAAFFAENNFLKYLKPRALFVDEPYFVQLMYQHDREFENACMTYTEWKFGTDSPIVFENVDSALAARARKSNCWFLRKVSKTATMSPEFRGSIGLT